MVIREDLYDIYRTLIAKKGEMVTRRLIEHIRNMPKKSRARKALKNTFIYKDLMQAIEDQRYRIIFENHVKKEKILKIAGDTVFEDGIIKELAYMKKHRPYTYRHELIVGLLTIKMTISLKKYHLNSKTASYGAITHDVGKNRIPRGLLSKKKALTVIEYELLKSHPTIGYLLLLRYERKTEGRSAIMAYQHHERLDGSGYPIGLRKTNIYSQLVAVNDVLDALIEKRPYREEPYKLRVALDYLLDEAKANRLNLDAVYALISYARKSKPDIKTIKVSEIKRGRPPKKSVYGKIIPDLMH